MDDLARGRAVVAAQFESAVFLMVKDGHWRRQAYMSLHAATKALERARANGREARMQLIELVPVPVPAVPVVVVGLGGGS